MTGTRPTARPLAAASLVVLVFCSLLPSPAQAFECPVPQGAQGPGVLKETPAQVRRTASLRGSGDAGNRVTEIVAELRKRHPGVRSAELVDCLVTAYCPVVAGLSGLSGLGDAEKTARVDRFASHAIRAVGRQ